VSGWVILPLLVAAEVDDRADAVVEQGLPAGVRELTDAVRAHDTAVLGLASVGGAVAAEIARIEQALPG
jgi:hypothetical protein